MISPKIILLALFSLSVTCLPAQHFKNAVANYNSSIISTNNSLKSFLNEKSTSSNHDSIKTLITKLSAFNEKKYQTLINIKDTSVAKLMMTSETADLISFNTQFISDTNTTAEQKLMLASKVSEINWLTKNLPAGLNLETCADCYFSRKIKVCVIKRQNNVLDTIQCSKIDYFKDVPFQTNIKHSEIESLPCSSEKPVSTGRKHTFTIVYNGQSYKFVKDIPAGTSSNDIYKIPLIIEL
jgi:hypothetical protein